MSVTKFFSIDFYLNQFGYTKASRLDIIKDEPTTDEDIERINIEFARKTREAVRWLGANGTDVGSIVTADIAGIVGSSVNIQSRVKNKNNFNEDVEEYIEYWSTECETTGRFHFNSALRAMVEFTDKDGGFLVRHHYNTAWEIPYQFELIEVGMIDTSKHDEKNNLLNGLQKNSYGKITGIYIFTSQERLESTLVSYDELIFFSPVWISLSQYTSVSKLASVLPTIDKLDKYTDAELNKVIEEAKSGVYWKTSMYDDLMKIIKATKDETQRKTQLQTLMNTLSESGVKPRGLTPIPLTDDLVKMDKASASVYPNMSKTTQGNIASSQGLSSQIVYQDSSDSNYSSIKAMMAFASIQWNIRWDDLEKLVVTPILKKVISAGVSKGQIRSSAGFFTNTRKFIKLEYMRVKEIDIEPAKTATADSTRLENGTISKREIARRRGRNYEDVVRERLEDELLENKLREQYNIPTNEPEDV
jgi:capsid protein